MSPAEISSLRLRRALAEIAADRVGLGKRLDEALAYAVAPTPLTNEQAAAAALALERAYTALESILERATRTLEGEAPSGPDWHRRLLDGALLAIDRVRPALLGQTSYGAADELLRFRHFLRHAYSADLDPQRVTDLVARIGRDRGSIDADLDALERFLASMADAVEG